MNRIKHTIVLGILWLVALIPLRIGRALGTLIGRVNYWIDSRSTKVTRVNLALCFPEVQQDRLERLVQRSLAHTGQMLVETPGVWLRRSAAERAIVAVEGEGLLTAALADERGVIILLPHLGNWEMFNVFIRRYGRMTALYQPPHQTYLQSLMAEVRERAGNELVPTDIRGLRTLYKRLGAGGTVTVLPDQVPETGRFVSFFGIPALTDGLISRLANRSNARVLSVVVWRCTGGYRVCVREPVADVGSDDPDLALAAVNQTIEAYVREEPEQYQWEYKRFRERPSGEEKLYSFRTTETLYH